MREQIATALGGAMVLGVLAVGAVDGNYAVRNWDRLGPAPPGTALTSFSVAMLDGPPMTHEDLQGRVSVVTFWATWCPACRSELEDLDELDDQFVEDTDVQFVAVNWEGRGIVARDRMARAKGYRDRKNLGIPVAVDNGAMAQRLRVGPIPHTVVLDRDGVVRHIHQGRVRSATIAEEVEELRREP